MSFTTWTVLPHDPIQILAENLWTVEGTMPRGNKRRMVVARLLDGRLIIHNAIALDPAEMTELEGFGEVSAIVVPNGFHRQDARIWKDRYPRAKVYAPGKALSKVSQLVSVDGTYNDIPRDKTFESLHLDGTKENEGVLVVQSADGKSLIFNDAILNMPKSSGVKGLLMSPTGVPSVPRFMRMFMVKDKRALTAQLRALAAPMDLKRIIVGHGANVLDDASQVMGSIADRL